MSRNPLEEGWRYYGCARWGCDAVNPDYQSYATKDGRSWCLHHRPGPLRRFLMAWTVFPAPPTRRGIPEGMLPIAVVHRHYERWAAAFDDAGHPDAAPMSTDEWPTEPVHLNHLEAMGIGMALMAEEQRDGLSRPQRDALEKVQATLGVLLGQLGRPA